MIHPDMLPSTGRPLTSKGWKGQFIEIWYRIRVLWDCSAQAISYKQSFARPESMR